MSDELNNNKYEQIIKEIDEINNRIWISFGNDLENEIKELSVAKFKSKQIGYQKGLAEVLLNEGKCRSYAGEYKKSFVLFKEAEAIFETIGEDEGMLKTINAIGIFYQNNSLYEQALEQFNKGLEIARENDNIERISAFINNIGGICFQLKRYSEALEYNEDGYELAKKSGNQQHLAMNYTNFGHIYLKLGETAKSLKNLYKACDIAQKNNMVKDYLESLSLICEVYLSEDNLIKAWKYIQKCKQYAKEKKIKFQEIIAFKNCGYYYLKSHKYHDAIKEFRYAHELSLKIDHKTLLESTYRGLYKVYKKLKDYKSALIIREEHDNLINTAYSKELQNKIDIITTGFSLNQSKKEEEIYRLRHVELKNKNSELKKSYETISQISEIGQKIVSTLDIEASVNTLYDNISRLMDSSHLGLAFYDKKNEVIDFRLAVDGKQPIQRQLISLHEKNSFAATCVRENRAVVVNDLNSTLASSKVIHLTNPSENTVQSLMYIPLSTDDNGIIGVLTVQSNKKDSYTNHHVELLKALGSYITSAIENSMKHQKLQQLNHLLDQEKQELLAANQKINFLANHDTLTGLPNRRLFMELLAQKIKEANRNDVSFALFFLDLNKFKEINDTYGHEVGDLVLKHASLTFSRVLREEDIVARLGGDEFVILCPNIDHKKSANIVASKILKAFSNKADIQEHRLSIEVSIGIALFPADAKTSLEIIKKADHAMYMAKKHPDIKSCFYDEIDNTNLNLPN